MRIQRTIDRRFQKACARLGDGKLQQILRPVVTSIARGYYQSKKSTITTDVDRPNQFTRNAYDWDGAKNFPGQVAARTFVKPRQAAYLTLDEYGGTRGVGGAGNRPMWAKPSVRDRFGGLYGAKGITNKFLSKGATPYLYTIKGRRPIYKVGARRYVVLKLNLPGEGEVYGVFEKRKTGARTTRGRLAAGQSTWKTRLIVQFETTATYKPKLGFHRDAVTYADPRLAPELQQAFEDWFRTSQQDAKEFGAISAA